jgi:hypothetical protein
MKRPEDYVGELRQRIQFSPEFGKSVDAVSKMLEEGPTVSEYFLDPHTPSNKTTPQQQNSDELAQYQRWQREDEHDDKLRHYPEYLLDDDELEAKDWLEDQDQEQFAPPLEKGPTGPVGEPLNGYDRAAELSKHEDVLTYTDPIFLSEQERRDRADFAENGPMPLAPLEKGPMGPMREPLTDFDAIAKAYEEGEKLSPQAPRKFERPGVFWMDHKGVHEWFNDGRRITTDPKEWLKNNPRADQSDRQGVIRALQARQKPGTGVNPAASMKAGSN